MKRITTLLATVGCSVAMSSLCCNRSPCDEPRKDIEAQIAATCDQGAGGLTNSRFCNRCMKAGYPSYEKVGGKCICGELAFGGACISVKDDERVRAAVAFADEDCSEFFLPTEDAGVTVPAADGGRP